MPSITTSRSRLGGCDWLPNPRLNPGSVTKSCEGVGRRLGISDETLRGWCRQAQIDAGEWGQLRSSGLRAENRRLREDVEILHTATTFFWGGRSPKPLIMGFIHTLRAEGHAVESICYVQREQGCHIAEQTY